MTYEFKTKLWEYQAPLRDGSGRKTTVWTMATVPATYFDEIREITNSESRRGFGSVRVSVTIGNTSWKTSIFPDMKSDTYVLPVKKDVRTKEKIEIGNEVKASIKLLDL